MGQLACVNLDSTLSCPHHKRRAGGQYPYAGLPGGEQPGFAQRSASVSARRGQGPQHQRPRQGLRLGPGAGRAKEQAGTSATQASFDPFCFHAPIDAVYCCGGIIVLLSFSGPAFSPHDRCLRRLAKAKSNVLVGGGGGARQYAGLPDWMMDSLIIGFQASRLDSRQQLPVIQDAQLSGLRIPALLLLGSEDQSMMPPKRLYGCAPWHRRSRWTSSRMPAICLWWSRLMSPTRLFSSSLHSADRGRAPL